jgi:MFS family permease
LRASTGDGAAFGVMVGVGETYLGAFALAVGLGEVSAGLISSVPLLAGGITQLISLRGVRWLGSEKHWIVFGAIIQALTFIPLVVAALYGSISLGTMLLIASVYWSCGLATGPAWNTWIDTIVPQPIRPRYFAWRTRVAQLTTFCSFLIGGLILQYARNHEATLYGFALLFFVAGTFRLVSASFLASHRTPKQTMTHSIYRRNGSRASETPVPSMNGARLLAYLVIVQGCVQISGPYFAPFMLEELKYTYLQFVGLLAISFLSKIIALSWWATIAKRHSAQMLLWIGAVSIVPLAAMWIVSRNFLWLALAQVLGGFGWAAYELGFFLMFFETLPIAKRTRMLTFYNMANSAAWCCGALIGGGLLYWLGSDQSAYFVLFGLSSCGRLCALILLARSGGPPLAVRAMGMRVLGIRPNAVPMDSPILPSIKRDAA